MKYKDLPDSGNPNMTCVNEVCCGFHILYSATRGDYFMAGDDEEVTCYDCGEPMRLAHEQRVLIIEGEEL